MGSVHSTRPRATAAVGAPRPQTASIRAWRSMACEMARRTRTSLKGGRSVRMLSTPADWARKSHIPPNLVVERFSQSSKASRGENLQVEHPICGGDAPAFHFYPTVARVLGSTLIWDQVVQVGEPRQKRPLAPAGMMKGFHHE